MTELGKLVEYGRWANRRVFALCLELDGGHLGDAARGSVGTVLDTLKHLVRTEDSFLAFMRDGNADSLGEREPYWARDLTWFAARAEQLADEYGAFLPAARLDAEFRVPWFDFPMTVADGALQAMTHSVQHRAQVLSVLGGRGLKVPDLDYVFMLKEQRGPG
jgi:uncharacterized damage-inducible protein DinB